MPSSSAGPQYAKLVDTTPCKLCATPTPMLGTRLCGRCWELDRRVRAAPEIARRILAELDQQQ